MAVPNSTFSDDFAATAIDLWAESVLMDQVLSKTAVLSWLRKNQKPAPGGLHVNEPLRYALNSQAGAFSKGETLDAADIAIATNAQYNWYTYRAGIAYYPEDQMKAGGDTQKVDLLEAKMRTTEDSLRDAINTDMWLTSWTSTGNQFIPVPIMTDASTTIGGIAPGTYTWWVGRYNTTTEAISTSRMMNIYNSCSLGSAGREPGLIATTQTIWESLAELHQPYLVGSVGRDPGDLAFPTLKWNGTPIVFDENCPSGYMFFLNADFIKFRPHTDCANKFLVWTGDPHNQIAHSKMVWLMFTVTSGRRLSLGYMSNKS